MQKLLGDEVGEREVDGRHRDGAAAAAACATFVHQRVHQSGELAAYGGAELVLMEDDLRKML